MSENQINVFCKHCNSVIYAGRELTVEEQSDTKDQIVDFVNVIKAADPLVLEIKQLSQRWSSTKNYSTLLKNNLSN